jgi:vanillate O-demethylase ferredoxin subunit
VLRDPGSRGGSRAMHDAGRTGSTLTISAPKNHFPLVHAARAAARRRHRRDADPGDGRALAANRRDFEMHYCARSPERTAFATNDRGLGFAAGAVPLRRRRRGAEARPGRCWPAPMPARTCTSAVPQGFIDYVRADRQRAAGWPAAQLHVEYFGAAPQDTTGDQAFDVKLASAAQVLTVPAGTRR